MSSSKVRLDRYASVATLPVIAACGATVAVTNIAEADIVYQSVSLTLGGPGGEPAIASLDMGFAYIKFAAGNNSTGPENFMGAIGNKSLGLVANGSSKILRNFDAGEEIFVDKSNNKLALVGLGAKVNTTGGKSSKGSGKTKSIGSWALGDDDSVSGFMGFAVVGEDGPNIGWVSMSWDGSFLTIDGYAVETEVGTSIQAGAIPAPGAIGLLGLAAGAAGMRRKRQA